MKKRLGIVITGAVMTLSAVVWLAPVANADPCGPTEPSGCQLELDLRCAPGGNPGGIVPISNGENSPDCFL